MAHVPKLAHQRSLHTSRLTLQPLFSRNASTCHKLSLLLLLLGLHILPITSQQQDPTTMNGGSILAMAGKNCVALAVDKRFGSGPALVNIAPRHVLVPNPRTVVAFTGLEGDVQSLRQELQAQLSVIGKNTITKQIPDELTPRAVAALTSHVLYASRYSSPYFVEPMIVGLQPTTTTKIGASEVDLTDNEECATPFLCSLDMIGAKSTNSKFVCGGAAKSLYGTAEAFWKPNMSDEELVRVCAKAFLSALERDCLSGYGAVIYLIHPDKGIEEIDLETRND